MSENKVEKSWKVNGDEQLQYGIFNGVPYMAISPINVEEAMADKTGEALRQAIVVAEIDRAALNGDVEAIQFMGRDKVRSCAQGSTVYFKAADAKTVRLLKSYGVKPAKAWDERTPLFFCKQEKIESLVEVGYDINAQDMTGETALIAKVRYNCITDVAQMLTLGAQVDLPNSYGLTGLFFAKTPEMTGLLLGAGANPNARAKTGKRPLSSVFCAVQARLLLAAGANPNAQAKDGTTALFDIKDVDIAEVLLQFGADVNIQDNQGETVLFKLARTVRHPGSFEKVSESERFLLKRQYELWQRLLQANPNLNLQNKKKQTLFDVVKDADVLQDLRAFQRSRANQWDVIKTLYTFAGLVWSYGVYTIQKATSNVFSSVLKLTHQRVD